MSASIPIKYPPCPDHGTKYVAGCDACRARQRARVRANRAERLAAGRLIHGRKSSYDAGCRCQPCRLSRSKKPPLALPPQEGLSPRHLTRVKGQHVRVQFYNGRAITGLLLSSEDGVLAVRDADRKMHYIPQGRVFKLSKRGEAA